jgi:ABC-type polar amino acid transport system ATPase subunit
MVGVGKYYDKKAVLKDIYLSYFYGAKIDVLGLKGSGKSSLLRIMASVEMESLNRGDIGMCRTKVAGPNYLTLRGAQTRAISSKALSGSPSGGSEVDRQTEHSNPGN